MQEAVAEGEGILQSARAFVFDVMGDAWRTLSAGDPLSRAQREMLARLDELTFLGIPALPSDKAVRAAIERAWFEQQPLRITYVDGNFIETTRRIRIRAVLMERHETRLDAIDLETGEPRHFRLDRITRASPAAS